MTLVSGKTPEVGDHDLWPLWPQCLVASYLIGLSSLKPENSWVLFLTTEGQEP